MTFRHKALVAAVLVFLAAALIGYWLHPPWIRQWASVLILGLVVVVKLYDYIRDHRCKHLHVRCVHGDEIVYGTRGRRVRCLDCGRALDRPLPQVCTFTGQPH